MSEYDYLSVEVDGAVIDAWQSYRIDSDVFTAADAWSMTIGVGSSSSLVLRENVDYLREKFKPGTLVKVYAGHGDMRALQLIGVVDARDVRNDVAGGTAFSVEGRDRGAQLVDNAAPIEMFEQDDTIQSFGEKAMARFGIKVQGDPTLNRQIMSGGVSQKKIRKLQDQAKAKGIPAALISDKIAASIERGTITLDQLAKSPNAKAVSGLQLYQIKIKEAKPQAGESIWEFLNRHAVRNGALMRMTVDGNVMMMGIDDAQDPAHSLRRKVMHRGMSRESEYSSETNNILSGGERVDISTAYTKVIMYGRGKHGDATRSAFKGVAEDKSDDAPALEKLLVLHDSKIRTQADADKRAAYELAKARQGMHVLEYTLRGHGDGRGIYAADTVVTVDDDIAGVRGFYYVTGRSFNLTEGAGPTTTLRMVPKGSIVLLGEDA